MKQYAKRYELKDKAKDNLTGKYGTLILGFFLFSLIIAGVVLIFAFPYLISAMMITLTGTGSYDTSSVRFYQAGILIARILLGFLQFGLAYLCLNIVCGQRYNYKDVFFGFRKENLLKTLILSVVQTAVSVICLLPYEYLQTKYLTTQDFQWLLAALAALIAGYAIYIPIGLTLDITYYLLLDFPDRKAAAIIRDSFRIIRGHRKRFFLLQCSFIPLYLLCELSLGIGFLWLIPYVHMTLALFYLDLLNPREGN